MSKANDFIGMGRNPNPDVPDIPTGFGMALFKNADARKNFENLSNQQKTKVIEYIKSNNKTGEEAKQKINNTVEQLKRNAINLK